MAISRLVLCAALLGLTAALPPLGAQLGSSGQQWGQLGGLGVSRIGGLGASGIGGLGASGVGGGLGGSALARKQQAIVQLLVNVQQLSKLSEIQEIAQKWNIGQQANLYANTRVVKRFLDLWKQGTLGRDQPFSLYDDVQLDEAIALFDLFYFANDFDTFYKTAAWARQNVNQGQFAYALSVAVIYRPDTQGIQLPPIYEIIPNVFLDSVDVQQFTQAKMQGIQKYVALVNNSGLSDITNQEQILSYFTEDIGLNNYYAYAQLYNPFWMNSQKYGLNIQNRGENYYYVNRQILALYNLNRISNGLPELEPLDWSVRTIQPGYNPQLRYTSGQEIPARPNDAVITSIAGLTIDDILAIEVRIKDAIDSGYVISKDGSKISITSQLQGINILGNIIEGNADSVNSRYYGAYTNMIRSLVALIVDPEQTLGVVPGPLANPAIQLRDPAFYVVQQYIQGLLERYKGNLSPYSISELAFPGVSVKDIIVDQLITYFDLFDVDVSNVVGVSQPQEWDQLNYVAKTVRLNHKPFTIKVNVLSDKKVNGVLRIFLGPRQDELHTNFYGDSNVGINGQPTYDLNRLRKYFVELDRVPIQLNVGQNIIERPSRELTATVGDISPLRQLLGKKTVTGSLDTVCGIPDRMILPLGRESGLPLTLLAVVTPVGSNSVDLSDVQTIPYESLIRQSSYDDEIGGLYQKVVPLPSQITVQNSCTGLSTMIDQRPLAFPLDRPILSINQFYTPNMLFKDVIIQHLNTTLVSGSGMNIPSVIQGINSQL